MREFYTIYLPEDVRPIAEELSAKKELSSTIARFLREMIKKREANKK